MPNVSRSVREFLDQRRIAVAGVSRNRSQAANAVYRKLRDGGYEVFAVNPKATEVEGDRCYPDLSSIPAGLDGVVAVTAPEATEQIARDCRGLGITRLWMHRSFGEGSVSEEAARYCREHGIDVIVGGCPLMFCEPVDFGHRCMRWVLGLRGRLGA